MSELLIVIINICRNQMKDTESRNNEHQIEHETRLEQLQLTVSQVRIYILYIRAGGCMGGWGIWVFASEWVSENSE